MYEIRVYLWLLLSLQRSADACEVVVAMAHRVILETNWHVTVALPYNDMMHTEGFDTVDLREAKALLDDLRLAG